MVFRSGFRKIVRGGGGGEGGQKWNVDDFGEVIYNLKYWQPQHLGECPLNESSNIHVQFRRKKFHSLQYKSLCISKVYKYRALTPYSINNTAYVHPMQYTTQLQCLTHWVDIDESSYVLSRAVVSLKPKLGVYLNAALSLLVAGGH